MQIKLTVALLALVPLLSLASPAPSPFTKVPFANAKRQALVNNGVANVTALQAEVQASLACVVIYHLRRHVLISLYRKIARGFANFQANTGKVHPNDNGFRPAKRSVQNRGVPKRDVEKRASGRIQLTDDDLELWQGGVAVGTPLRSFTGMSALPNHTERMLTSIQSISIPDPATSFFLDRTVSVRTAKVTGSTTRGLAAPPLTKTSSSPSNSQMDRLLQERCSRTLSRWLVS